jgi:S-formylglutathione hydrolase FrmB
MDVYFPEHDGSAESFPLVAYSHGMLEAALGPIEYQHLILGKLLSQLASHGFIVASGETCNAAGCGDKVNAPYTDCAGLAPVAPDGWASYYGEQLKTIEWARNQSKLGDEIFQRLDVQAGAAIAGHSMGGQATTLSAHFECTKRFDIRVAALHHSANGATSLGNLGVNVSVPLAGFGSTGDASCTRETEEIFESSSVYPKVFGKWQGFSHLAPTILNYNPALATMTAAWFKVHLLGDQGEYHELIFGNSSESLCNAAVTEECDVELAPSSVLI